MMKRHLPRGPWTRDLLASLPWRERSEIGPLSLAGQQEAGQAAYPQDRTSTGAEAEPVTNLMQIRCVICEEAFDQNESASPQFPVGGVAVRFLDEAVHRPDNLTVKSALRAYLCDECVIAKGRNGLIHVIETRIECSYTTWIPAKS